MTREDLVKDFLSIQVRAEEILGQIVRNKIEINFHTLLRLEKLSTAGAKLAYGNDCLKYESAQMHNLIAWCDRLDDADWKAEFIQALKHAPLRSPWKAQSPNHHS